MRARGARKPFTVKLPCGAVLEVEPTTLGAQVVIGGSTDAGAWAHHEERDYAGRINRITLDFFASNYTALIRALERLRGKRRTPKQMSARTTRRRAAR